MAKYRGSRQRAKPMNDSWELQWLEEGVELLALVAFRCTKTIAFSLLALLAERMRKR
jgi:hypothetical protein